MNDAKSTDKLEISRMLTLSTSHIQKTTAEFLDSNQRVITVFPKSDYGWFVFIGSFASDFELISECSQNSLPDDLRAAIELVLKNQCDWLCLDCDGEAVEQLPVFDWG